MRKPKELYQEGFLCLFDKQGEMFFRGKTVSHYGNWALTTAHQELYTVQDAVINPEGLDPCDVPQWHPTWMDAAFLHDGNEEIDEFCFIGHFDIDLDSKHANGLRYSFGRGYMEGPGGISRVDLATEGGWEYTHHDTDLFGTINMDKLRVVID